MRWTISWHPHAAGLTGETREMQENATPAKEPLVFKLFNQKSTQPKKLSAFLLQKRKGLPKQSFNFIAE